MQLMSVHNSIDWRDISEFMLKKKPRYGKTYLTLTSGLSQTVFDHQFQGTHMVVSINPILGGFSGYLATKY